MDLKRIKKLSEEGELLFLTREEAENNSEKKLPPFIWINEFLSITGSYMYDRENDRPPNDLDIVIKADALDDGFMVKLDPSLRLKIDRIMTARFGIENTQWIGSPPGPNWKYRPLYDLALVPRSNTKPVEMDEPEFADEFCKEQPEPQRTEKQFHVFQLSKSEDERIVCGIVYAPDKTDLQGDKASAEEIKKAAWTFMENGGVFRFNHGDGTIKATTLETFIAPVDYTVKKNNGVPVTVKKGSWVLTARINDPDIWKLIKTGQIVGYSMAGKSKVRST